MIPPDSTAAHSAPPDAGFVGADASRPECLRALESLVKTVAREEILPRYHHVKSRHKADGSLLTDADLASQRHFSEVLPKFISGPVLGEEMDIDDQLQAWRKGRSGLWCIDPIDGTTNFVNGIPFFAVSIAYLVDHEPVLGIVYNPVTDESFSATKEGGAWLNGMPLPLRVPAERLRGAVAGVDFKRIGRRLRNNFIARPPFYSQRNFGSSALEWCYTAAGRLDVYLHGGQMLWDYAAGSLILRNAGGYSTALGRKNLLVGPASKRAVVAAASPALFEEWLKWLKAHV